MARWAPPLIERLQLQEGNLSGVAHHPWVGIVAVFSGQRTYARGRGAALRRLAITPGQRLTIRC